MLPCAAQRLGCDLATAVPSPRLGEPLQFAAASPKPAAFAARQAGPSAPDGTLLGAQFKKCAGRTALTER